MSEITEKHTVKAYETGKRICAGEISKQEGIEELTDQGMNAGSANNYLRSYECMINGEEYKMTINAYSTKYYLARILIDDGEGKFVNALNAIGKHLEYQTDHNNLNDINTIYQKCLEIKNNNYESIVTAIIGLL
jgi:5-methylcytosine-specific restriction protein A